MNIVNIKPDLNALEKPTDYSNLYLPAQQGFEEKFRGLPLYDLLVELISRLPEGTLGSFFKGEPAADFNPGIPTSPVIYKARAGMTYQHFLDQNGQPITIPTKVGEQWVSSPYLVWKDDYWITDWTLVDKPDLSGEYVPVSQKNAPNGVAALDENGNLSGYTTDEDFSPVKQYVETIQPVLMATDIDGYIMAFIDSENHLLGGWRSDGSFDVPKLLDSSVSFSKLNADATDLMLRPINSDTGYIGGWFDSEDRILLGIKSNGEVYIPNISTADGARFLQLNAEDTGYIGGWFDAENRILLGIKSNGRVTFLNEDLEDLKIRVATLENGETGIKDVICVGDSLTAATYPSQLQILLGESYRVVNRGVGGENVPTIAARVGAVPAVLSGDVILPALSTDRVEIANYAAVENRLKNKYDGRTINWIRSPTNTLNSVYVADIECNLIIEGANPDGTVSPDAKIYLRRLVNSDSPTQLKAGMPIYPVTAKLYRKPYAGVYFIGQNRGYDVNGVDDNAVLVAYYRKLIDFLGTPNYLVVGLHTQSEAQRADLEELMLKEFGLRYINLREYMTLYGLADAGLTPTSEDIAAMAEGRTPPSLMTDGTHFTPKGYSLLAALIHKRMKQLNIA
ncbi:MULTISPECIES: hypothetical protein [Olivibacter]|uniref:SGNH/GDSL hydrolase family protein n=1 Tax=Olivibacter jilunii TaxID=985016 RepID=A0ABW6B3Z6_9SPHI